MFSSLLSAAMVNVCGLGGIVVRAFGVVLMLKNNYLCDLSVAGLVIVMSVTDLHCTAYDETI